MKVVFKIRVKQTVVAKTFTYRLISYFIVSVLKFPDQKQLRGERVLCGPQFQKDTIQSVKTDTAVDKEDVVAGSGALWSHCICIQETE